MIIRKVWERRAGEKHSQKLVTIPKESDIQSGDYVSIQKVRGEQKQADINLSAIAKTKTKSANQAKADKINEEIRNARQNR